MKINLRKYVVKLFSLFLAVAASLVVLPETRAYATTKTKTIIQQPNAPQELIEHYIESGAKIHNLENRSK